MNSDRRPGHGPEAGAIVVVAVLLLVLRVLGTFTVGVIATPSMSPGLPPGTLFLSLPFEPEIGDVVVFHAPTGERIVHRAVEATPDGLVTKGDANPVTDQAVGIPPVDPDDTQTIPTLFGRPLAVPTPVVGPAALIGAQVLVLVLVLILVLGKASHAERTQRLRLHHVVAAAAVMLLALAPGFQSTFAEEGDIEVHGSFLPTMVRVNAQDESRAWTLAPFGSQETGMNGPAEIVVAPAMPGAQALSQYGAVAAFAPSAAALAGAALYLRRRGL